MVEVDVQFLAGVAVTVFLALLFFGVVVLWDVALALRSVGDKIDKLEDNVDDDLKDIGYSLNNISNAPGGGTQLHLGGGTISSGPATNQHAQQQGESPHHGHTTGAQPRQDDPSRPTDPTSQQQPQPGSPGFDEQPQGAEAAGSDSVEVDEERDTDHREDESAVADESVDDSTDETTESDDSTTPTDTDVEHPRASINRGRFIASPDRTPWYATPLDREAIDNAGPVIAGALEAGEYEGGIESDDEATVIAVGPPEETASTGDDPIVATAPPADRSSESEDESEREDGRDRRADERPEEQVDTEVDTDRGADADTSADDTGYSDPTTGSSVEDTDNDSDGRPAEDAYDRSEDEERNTFTFTDTDSSERPTDEAGENEHEDSAETLEIEYRDEDDDLEVATDEADATVEGGDDVDTVAAGEVAPAQAEQLEDSLDTDGHAGEEQEEVEEGEGPADEDEEHERELSIDEAIDSMNDDSPALSLSSHGFDVTAESNDEGAVLHFEFDPDTIDISGPTKRLLRYQLRSFAERASTPDGEVTIDENTIVVELPDASGDAVSKWGEGTVSIIDRTLYLSDNSN